MTLEEMEVQAQRALDGMKVNLEVMARNQIVLIALVRNAKVALAKAKQMPGAAGSPIDEMLRKFTGGAL
ncbi:hypothetical protein ACSFA8_20730 [Variovorax sp. RT4R15]|uniref:hypothetical protein n=1 Tax=Variovorax sp. RT4R15 TaxID=3443737 RepID=UPI003F446BDE